MKAIQDGGVFKWINLMGKKPIKLILSCDFIESAHLELPDETFTLDQLIKYHADISEALKTIKKSK